MRGPTKKLVPVIVFALPLASIGWILVHFTPLGIVLRQNSGYFDRAHFDAVVAQVRLMPLTPDKETSFRLDDLADAKSLRPVKPDESFHRGAGAGRVWALLNKDGKLTVVIETRDLGHAGEYGFAYSDIPLVARPWEGGWSTLDVPSRLQLVQPDMKIDDHWWKVLNNLD